MLQPKLYSENSKITIEANKYAMDKYRNLIKWQKQSSILEFGMADGRNSLGNLIPNIPEDFKEFIGSDVSKIMVDHLKEHIEHPKMKFIELDIETKDVPFDFANRFDNIFGFFVMHWMKNPGQAFFNMFKMLKPGGQIFLTFTEETPVDEALEILSKSSKWKKYGHENYICPFYRLFDTKSEVERLLQENGYSNYICDSEMRSYEFANAKMFHDLYTAVSPIYPKLSKEEASEYLIEYLNLVRNGRMNSVICSEKTGVEVFRSQFKLFVVIAFKPL